MKRTPPLAFPLVLCAQVLNVKIAPGRYARHYKAFEDIDNKLKLHGLLAKKQRKEKILYQFSLLCYSFWTCPRGVPEELCTG